MKRQRLDRFLVERGFFATERNALGPIMAGQVVVNGKVISKAGELVKADADVALRGRQLKFASRGGYKLESALKRFEVDVTGRCALDTGASTGGFTDCLLMHGASKVYAVDVGYGQLKGRLAADERVVSLEQTNLSDLKLSHFACVPSFCTLDLSYLSLKKAIPIVHRLLPEVEMICLLKPLYEGLKDVEMARIVSVQRVLEDFFGVLDNVMVRDVIVSPLLGGRGAVEFLIHVIGGGRLAELPAVLANRAMLDWQHNPPLSEPVTQRRSESISRSQSLD